MRKRITVLFFIVIILSSCLSFPVLANAGDRLTPYSAYTERQFSFVPYSWEEPKQVSLVLLSLTTGEEANAIIQEENPFNDDPTSDQQWLLFKFHLKYISGPEETLDAYELISSYSFYTSSGTQISPTDTATFSGSRSGMGVYDVSMYPNGESDVWFGMLVNKSAGYPLLRVETGYDSNNYKYIYSWFSTDPNNAEIRVQGFVSRFYQLCLNRSPDAVGLIHWSDSLVNKTMTGADVAYGFVFSQEFIGSNINDDAFITIMYRAFFNREPDSGGFDTWKTALRNGMSRYYVLRGFTNSQEFQTLCSSFGILPGSLNLTDAADLYPSVTGFVNRFYQTCLDRTPDRGGINDWVNKLVTKERSGCDVAYGFVFSPEFTSKSLSNDQFVTVMYRAFFDREPDSAGYNDWVAQLNNGTSRKSVLAGFVNSVEFGNLCESYGIARGTL